MICGLWTAPRAEFRPGVSPAGVFIRLQGSEVSMGASDSQVKNGDTALPYQRFRVYLGPGNEGWLTHPGENWLRVIHVTGLWEGASRSQSVQVLRAWRQAL